MLYRIKLYKIVLLLIIQTLCIGCSFPSNSSSSNMFTKIRKELSFNPTNILTQEEKDKMMRVYPDYEYDYVKLELSKDFPFSWWTRSGFMIDIYYDDKKIASIGYGAIAEHDYMMLIHKNTFPVDGTYTIYYTSDTSIHTSFVIKR